jgi:hypothetical protein
MDGDIMTRPDEICPECNKPACVEFFCYFIAGYELKCRDCEKFFWYDENGKLERVLTFKEKELMVNISKGE